MNKEEKYLKELMQELPREKAPEGITQLIMQKIEKKREFALLPKMVWWETLSFWLFVTIALSEAWLLWSHKQFLTFEYARSFVRVFMRKFYEFTAVQDINSLLLYAIAFAGLGIFLWREDRKQRSYTFSI